ncbi:MAG: CRISPR-associated endonuclease Cas2 [Caldisericum sp.]|jgi:CRISPR-associated protein Cas2|uniref:CRISPR-associated endonuclease Cas2 n=1 Tax=Caldisericum sp. TaxID=2499687 RepID=UPI003D12E16A
MYVILVYDIDVSRVNRINKYLKRYLLWIQNSVFEGELNDELYNKMLNGLKKLIKDNDSIIIYKLKNKTVYEKDILGIEKSSMDNII